MNEQERREIDDADLDENPKTGKGVLIVELLGPDDGPYRPWGVRKVESPVVA